MSSLTLTTVGRNMLRNGLIPGNNLYLYYVALGTGTSSPSAINTLLDAEIFRKAVSSYTEPSDGTLVLNCYIEPSEAVGYTIGEVGVFGGSTASILANSGILLGRGLYSPPFTKPATYSLPLQFTLTFS